MDNPFIRSKTTSNTPSVPSNPFIRNKGAITPEEQPTQQAPVPQAPTPQVQPTVEENKNPNLDTSNLEKVWAENDKSQAAFSAPAEPRSDTLQTSDDLYSRIDKKYDDMENQVWDQIYKSGTRFANDDQKAILNDLRAKRNQEKDEVYNQVGKKSSFLGSDIRVQDKVMNDEDTGGTRSQEYLVPKPNESTFNRMAYQLVESTIGGLGDLASYLGQPFGLSKGGILREGSVSEAMPDTVPNSGMEQFIDEFLPLAIGPGMAKGAVKGVAEGANAVAKSSEAASMAQAMMSKLSPQAISYVKNTYENAIKAGLSTNEAYRRSAVAAKYLTVGLALGVTEAGLSGENQDPFIGDKLGIDSALVKHLGVSPSSAKDFAMVLDTPVMNGFFRTLGVVAKKSAAVGADMFGGIKNIKMIGGTNVGGITSKIPKFLAGENVDDYGAGLQFVQWLDPNLKDTKVPEIFANRIQFLRNSLERNAERELQLGTASATVKNDTAMALIPVAEDYYRNAYANLLDHMEPHEFDKWVKSNAVNMANRLFEERTALRNHPDAAAAFAKNSQNASDLLSDAAKRETTSGDLIGTTEQAGTIAGTAQKNAIDDLAQQKIDVENNNLLAREDVSNKQTALIERQNELKQFLDTNPNAKEILAKVGDVDNLLSDSKLQEQIARDIPEPIYQAWKNIKQQRDSAYEAIGNSGVKGDELSLMKIITDADPKLQDPRLKKIYESVKKDPSYGNMYNNIRNNVNKTIAVLNKNATPVPDVLYEIRDNITDDQLRFFEKKGDPTVRDLVVKARESNVNYQSIIGDDSRIKNLINKEGYNRLNKESLEAGGGNPLGQGVTDWNRETTKLVRSGLEGEDGKAFSETLGRLAKGGGQDIDKALGSYYTNKALMNLFGKVSKDGTVDVNGIRSALGSGIIENLERYNPDLAKKYRDLAADLETHTNLINNAKDTLETSKVQRDISKTANDRILAKLKGFDDELKSSVLNKFLVDGKTLKGADTKNVLESIFNSRNGSTTQLEDLLKRSDSMGADGKIIKEAVKGQYIEYLKSKMFSSKSIGTPDLKDGKAVRAFAGDEKAIEDMFKEGDTDLANMKLLFSDRPEMIDQLKEVADTLMGSTKTIGAAKEQVFGGKVPINQNPLTAISTAIAIKYGSLNPTAVTLRKITTPIASRSLEHIKQVRNDLLIKMMSDPEYLSGVLKTVSKKMTPDEKAAAISAAINAGIKTEARSNTWSGIFNTTNEGNLTQEERDKKKVPEGVK